MNRFPTLLSAAAVMAMSACHGSPGPVAEREAIEELKLETLNRTLLKLVDGVEVVMSRVSVPPRTALPSHYHPGEEFVFMLEGSGTIRVGDGEAVTLREGDAFVVPLKAVHAFTAGPEGARALVCRVHEPGKPERIPVKMQD